MRPLIGVFIFSLICCCVAAEPPVVPCGRTDGGGWSSQLHAYSIAIDGAGNIAIAGWLAGTVDFGSGPVVGPVAGMFVSKFDRHCGHLWSKSFATSDFAESFIDVRFDASGNLFLAGNIRSSADFGGGLLTTAGDYDIILVKLGPDGSHLWSKRFGDSQNQIVNQIEVDGAGNFALVGTFRGQLDFGLGPLTGQAYLARFDTSGTPVFSKAFTSTDDFQLQTVALGSDGTVAVSGVSQGSLSLGGDTFSFDDHGGGVVGKFDQNGAYLWSAGYGGGLAFGPGGDLFVLTFLSTTQSVLVDGQTLRGPGGFVVRVDTHDVPHFWRRIPQNLAYGLRTFVIDSSGGLTIGGSTGEDYADIGIFRFDAQGRQIYFSRHGDPGLYQALSAVAVGPSGELVLTGGIYGSLRFGDIVLTGPPIDMTDFGIPIHSSLFLVRFDAIAAAAVADVPAMSTGVVILTAILLAAVALHILKQS